MIGKKTKRQKRFAFKPTPKYRMPKAVNPHVGYVCGSVMANRDDPNKFNVVIPPPAYHYRELRTRSWATFGTTVHADPNYGWKCNITPRSFRVLHRSCREDSVWLECAVTKNVGGKELKQLLRQAWKLAVYSELDKWRDSDKAKFYVKCQEG